MLKNIITELKNTPERLTSRLDKAEHRISELKDKVVELSQSEQQNEKGRIIYDTCSTTSNKLTFTLQGSWKKKEKRTKNI